MNCDPRVSVLFIIFCFRFCFIWMFIVILATILLIYEKKRKDYDKQDLFKSRPAFKKQF